ncbi:poly-beta-hydroxybutyrate-responsive repressor [Desertibacillus haloalkaliphilus]|uniref:poly-beta-hydroxybutyrate-responsive repressor n=1 Tax=Desertibacillus haloalkaliphilus TaxID=1328930 RepID=UPI0028B13AC0|nr:poly-beta-hydroxybutyrate-responsive repressor [Desertibacillus haloalkaliphilus]
MAADKKKDSISPPKNFLLPFILLLLSKMSLHGYDLIQRLTTFGFHSLDQGNIYRMLRKMEKEELVCSEWDTTGPGPAKRLYSITEAGHTYLTSYASQLEQYQSMLDQFFTMYTSMLELYIPPLRNKEDKIEESNEDLRRNHDGTEKEEDR